jgi:hypothetical protein
MQISVGLFISNWKMIMAAIVVLITGKLAVMLAAGQMFGLSRLAALRSGEAQKQRRVELNGAMQAGWQASREASVPWPLKLLQSRALQQLYKHYSSQLE